MPQRLAILGAGGFVGRHLTRIAASRRIEVVGLVRSDEGAARVVSEGGLPMRISGLDAASLAPALRGASAVVHLAMIGHETPGASYDAVNVEGTRQLLLACRQSGVSRLAVLSGLGAAGYGLAPRLTNRYFLSKLAAEVEVFRSGIPSVVFRPSYIVGRGDGFVSATADRIRAGPVEIISDGSYRLQPISVADAAEAILAGVFASSDRPRVFDLVGPEPLSYRSLVLRLSKLLGASVQLTEVEIAVAERAAASGGFHGLTPDELDVLLCDAVADFRPLEGLLGRFLKGVDEALAAALPAGDLPGRRG